MHLVYTPPPPTRFTRRDTLYSPLPFYRGGLNKSKCTDCPPRQKKTAVAAVSGVSTVYQGKLALKSAKLLFSY